VDNNSDLLDAASIINADPRINYLKLTPGKAALTECINFREHVGESKFQHKAGIYMLFAK
jgi:hypothetical protein